MNISVVIPLYNKEDDVLGALHSVFNQTFLPKEIIVVNDGSTDNSENLVKELNHPLVQMIHQTNAGVSVARNKGIEIATGDWIAFLDADDEWKPDYLQTVKFLAKTYPHCSVLATAYELENFKGKRSKIVLNNLPFSGSHGVLNNYFEVASSSNPPIWTSAVTVKKEALQNIKGFPEGIISGEDLLTWAKLAIENKIAFHTMEKALFRFISYRHSKGKKKNRPPSKVDLVGLQLLKLYSVTGNKDFKKYISKWHNNRLIVLLKNKKYRQAFLEGYSAIKFNPYNLKNYILILMIFTPKIFKKKMLNR